MDIMSLMGQSHSNCCCLYWGTSSEHFTPLTNDFLSLTKKWRTLEAIGFYLEGTAGLHSILHQNYVNSDSLLSFNKQKHGSPHHPKDILLYW